jgi:2-C-methyl-D-erythritol 4-phosphate cytidylyltransferase
MANVSVIIPAAGAGMRFAAERNKIFQPLGGRAVFLRTLSLFAGRADVCQILLVVSAEDMAEMQDRFDEQLADMNVTLVVGGPTRSESVRNALARVGEAAEIVCVHDAVRPCVRQDWIDAVFAAAQRCGAAILAYPVHGTLKRVDADGVIERTVCREDLWEAQTPQVFRKDLLAEAYQRGTHATDDAELVQSLGHHVEVVPGDPRNIKITTPADLDFAAAVIESL